MKMLTRLAVTCLALGEIGFLVNLLHEVPTVEVTAPEPIQEGPVEPAPMYAPHCDQTPPDDFDAYVVASAWEFDIDPRLLATTVYRESDCNPTALGSSGEIGLGQVHPKIWTKTLQARGIITASSDLWDPRTNLRASAFILSRVHKAAKGDLHGTFRRYNGSGPQARKYATEQVHTFAALWP